MGIADEIRKVLAETFRPSHLEVTDETGNGKKFRIVIVSDHFANKTTLGNHRSVQNALGALMPSIHALTIEAYDKVKWSQRSS